MKLSDLARIVLLSYNVYPKSIELIQGDKKKTVWRVVTSDRCYGLKKLKHSLEKMHFSIQAHKYIEHNNGPVPRIIRTRKGSLYSIDNEQVFVLYDWIDGKNPSFSSSSDLQKATETLARFHKASIGFVPAIPCRVSSKWGKWMDQYHTMMKHCHKWKHSRHYSSLSHADQRHIKEIMENGERAKKLLSRSNYENWIRKKKKWICHLDFSEKNVMITKNGCVILDLDSITYDLPMRDLQMIIHKEMVKKETWDSILYHKMIAWYTRKNPLTKDQLNLLYIVCFFPHTFYEMVINPFMKHKQVSSFQLARAIRIELAKKKALAAMIR